MEDIQLCKYALRYVKTEAEPYLFHSLETIADDLQDGYILLFRHNQILAGIIEKKKITWLAGDKPGSDIISYQKIHAFNGTGEIYLYRKGDVFAGRKRTDSGVPVTDEDESLTPFFETKMVLRPEPGKKFRKNENEKYLLVSRNFIDFNKYGQAGIVDSRMVSIEKL